MLQNKYFFEFFYKKILSLGLIQFINFFITIFLISYLLKLSGPNIWGKFILLQIWASYLGWFCQWSFSFNELRQVSENRYKNNELKTILSESISIQFFLCLISIFLIFFFYILNLIDISLIGLIGLILIIIGHGTQYQWFLNGLELFWQSGLFPIFQKILIIVFIYFMFSNNIDINNLIFSYGISSVLVNVVMILYINFNLKISLKLIANIKVFNRFKEGLPFFTSSFLSNARNTIIPISLGLLHGDILVGYFNAIDRIKSLLIQISHPIIHAVYPRVSYLLSINSQKTELMKKNFLLFSIFVISPFILLILIFPDFILLNYAGKQFSNITFELKIISFVSILTIISEYNLYQTILAAGLKKLFFLINLLGLFVVIFFSIFLIKYYALVGAVITILLFEIFNIILIYYGPRFYAK